MFYTKGWVLDLSASEKTAKRKLDRFGGLGFVDSKKAYYGIYASGPLRLLLPYQQGNATGVSGRQPRVGDRAIDWFKAVVLCEVNEKREGGACSTQRDVRYVVGGVNATEKTMMDAAGTLYLGKKLCLHIPVPPTAQLTTRALLKKKLPANPENQVHLPASQVDETLENQVGLAVEMSVNSMHIIKREQACSLSHVVWEQQGPGQNSVRSQVASTK